MPGQKVLTDAFEQEQREDCVRKQSYSNFTGNIAKEKLPISKLQADVLQVDL